MATSKLQREVGRLLDKKLPEFTVRENYRPDWLLSSQFTKLELDFYIEELKTAFEIQGAQHYSFIEFFHRTPENFEKRKLYDQQKRDLCEGAGVRLIEIFTLTDAEVIINGIQEQYGKLPTPYYFDGDGYKPIDPGKYYREQQQKGVKIKNWRKLEKQRARQSAEQKARQKIDADARAIANLEHRIQNGTNKAIIELDRWEKKVITCGKLCKWHPIDLPEEIANKINRKEVTFEQARAQLFRKA